MPTVIQVKRGTAAAWTSANTVLTAGEIGFESDTKKMKVGDGSTAWTSLAYTATDGDITAVVAGTGLSGGSTSGSATLSIDTATTVDKTTAQTLTNKTLTSPVLTTPSISTMTTTGDILYASSANTPARLGIGSTGQSLVVASGVPSWATPAASTPSFVGCLLYREAHISVSGATPFAIPFNNEPIDTDSFHSNTVNNSRITIPAGKDGKYLLIGAMGVGAVNSADSTIKVYVNGANPGSSNGGGMNTDFLDRDRGGTATGNDTRGSMVITLTAGDYIELFGTIDTTSNAYIIANFSATFLGA